jgi:hypothetical protein
VLVGSSGCDQLWNLDHVTCAQCNDAPGDGSGDGSNGGTDDSGIDADPNADDDGDGIVNGMDNCPSTQNLDQHDHDSDGKGDACDPCPHLPSSSGADVDADGDGLGTGCDPNPMTPGDTLALFAGFYGAGDIGGWNAQPMTAWTVMDGVLRVDASAFSGATIELPGAHNDVFVQVGLHATTLGSGSFRLFTISAGRDGVTSHDCTLSDPDTGNLNQLIYNENSANKTANWSGQLTDTSRLTLMLRGTRALCAVAVASAATLDNNPAGPNTATHTGILGFVVTQAAIDIDYIFFATPG